MKIRVSLIKNGQPTRSKIMTVSDLADLDILRKATRKTVQEKDLADDVLIERV